MLLVKAVAARLTRLKYVNDPRLSALKLPAVRPPCRIENLPISTMLAATLNHAEILDTTHLAQLSVAELMDLPSMWGRRVLEILAVLERYVDGRSVAPTLSRSTHTMPPNVSDLAEILAIEKILGEADIDVRDIRFGPLVRQLGSDLPTLKGALTEFKDGLLATDEFDPWPSARERLDAFGARLRAIHQFTLSEDLMDVLTTLTSVRKARIVALRLGWLDGVERTLQEVGTNFGITRERVRQMESRAQQKLSGCSVYVPSLSRAMRLARHLTPCSAAAFSTALIDTGLTEVSWTPGVLVRAAGYLGVRHGLSILEIDGRGFLGNENHTAELFDRVRRLSWEYSRTEGAAHLPRIAFALSEELGRRVSLAEIHALVTTLSETKWIDEAQGWYWLGEDGNTAIFNTLRKLLAVARRLPIDDVYAGLLKSYRMDASVVAPKTILLKLFTQVSWLAVRQSSHIEAVPPLQWQDVLVGVEHTMVQVLKAAGGVLSHHDFKRRCRELGIPHSSFGVNQGNSSLFIRIGPAVWGLRGVAFEAEKFLQASHRIAERKLQIAIESAERALRKLPEPSTPSLSANLGEFMRLYRVTASAFRNHIATFARLKHLPIGMRLSVALDAVPLGKVAITVDRRLRGLIPLLKHAGIKPGQSFLAQFDIKAAEIHLTTVGNVAIAEDAPLPAEPVVS
jgi:hypothetical protein